MNKYLVETTAWNLRKVTYLHTTSPLPFCLSVVENLGPTFAPQSLYRKLKANLFRYIRKNV